MGFDQFESEEEDSEKDKEILKEQSKLIEFDESSSSFEKTEKSPKSENEENEVDSDYIPKDDEKF